MTAKMPTPLQVQVQEKDVIRLVLDFLKRKELYLSMRSVERESGIVNGLFSEDVLFLRQLILDGQWDDVLEFIQPVERIESFEAKRFRYLILKHKLLEMLCLRSEDLQQLQIEFSTEEVVSCLNELEPYCPSREDYNSLCFLLTLPRLSDQAAYKDWSPSSARAKCFEDVYPLVSRFLPVGKNLREQDFVSSNDRLVQLLIKGMLFESCVDFCQQKATGKDAGDVIVSGMLHGSAADDSDLSLLSWLQSIPTSAFNCPFERRSLKVEIEEVVKPSTSWSEQIMTPMTPTPGSKSRMNPSPSPTTPTLYRGRPWSSNRPFSQSLSQTLESALLNQVPKKDDQGIPESLSRSFANFHIGESGLNNTFSGQLAPVAEASERHVTGKPVGTSQPPQVQQVQANPRSTSSGIDDLKQSRERLQREWQEQERRGQLLRQQLTGESPEQTAAPSQTTPPEFHLDRPLKVDSSTPKVMSFNPRLTPEPDASPILTKVEHQNREKSLYVDHLNVTSDLARQLNMNSRESERHPLQVNQTYNVNSLMQSAVESVARPAVQSETGELDSDLKLDNQCGVNSAEGNTPWTPPVFTPVSTLEDVQAIRAVTFDPTGEFYAVGSNSKTLRICRNSPTRGGENLHQPTVLFKRMRHHKGSIYSIAWSPTNNLVATGSNDKLIKLIQFDPSSCNAVGPDSDLTFHDGTVRDLVFQASATRGPTLISGGAGDCNIYVTDCQKGQPVHAMSGHTGHVLALYSQEEMLVSGSQDSTVRIWDLRSPRCVQVIGTPGSDSGQGAKLAEGSVAASVTVDRSGRLLASGQEDSSCMLYDIRGGRVLQTYNPHKGEIRSVRFSPKGYFLLSGSYDGNIVMSNLTTDLLKPVEFGVVGQHQDKVIQCRWHPSEPSFLSSSADRTVTLWCLEGGS